MVWRVIVTRVLCSAALPEAAPSEFRLFAAGENATSKGVFTFDAAAASRVMAAYQRAGVDVMIDLEHLSLDDPAATPRTDTKDARGWAKLELRGGELWGGRCPLDARRPRAPRKQDAALHPVPRSSATKRARAPSSSTSRFARCPRRTTRRHWSQASRGAKDKRTLLSALTLALTVVALANNSGTKSKGASHPKGKASSARR